MSASAAAIAPSADHLAHEEDDCRHHEPWCHDRHLEGDGIGVEVPDHGRAGSHDDQQEGADEFTGESLPLLPRVIEVIDALPRGPFEFTQEAG